MKKILYILKVIIGLSFLVVCQLIQNNFLTDAHGYSLAFPPAVIVAILGLATAGVGVAGQTQAINSPKTQCEQDCVDACKASHKAIFGGRQKCIKECKGNCANQSNQPPPPPPSTGFKINWWYVASGVLIIGSIVLFIFRKKLFPTK